MSQETFTLTRIIDAPRERVWQAYTEADRLTEWWGPKGVKIHVAGLELQPGGTFLYGMELPTGQMMWGKWVFREIVAPERLVTVVSFADAEGNSQRHPLSPTWPVEMLSTATFTEENGRTKLVLEASALNATKEEQQTFVDGRASMEAGFGGTFAQLDAYLAKREES